MPTGVYPRTLKHRKNISQSLTGKKRASFSKKHRENIGKSLRGKTGELARNWKGDDVGYGGVHIWIRKNLGSPLVCWDCGKQGGTTFNYHWANLTKEYKRDFEDWARLCVSCHKQYDLGKLQISLRFKR